MAAALGADLAAQALQEGLVRAGAPVPFHLRTAGGLYLLSDYLGVGSAVDAVMGAGETTAVLWQAARPSRPLRSALDLGCGAGTLALLLAAHAGRVIGCDINPRAIEFSRFNAALNGIANVEFRCGDGYAPVSGERFDLIVSQPPYYPRHSGAALTFLHGGERGDEIARRVVEGVAGQLAAGGRALIFSSWLEDDGPPRLPGHDMLALTTDRRELHHAGQTLLAIEPGHGWSATRMPAPQCWGEVTSGDLDRLLAAERWLRNPSSLGGGLRLPAAARVTEEAGVRLVELPLFGLIPVDDAIWEAVLKPGSAPAQHVAEAVRRGLLEHEAQ